jgi:hypothetical protein
VEGEERSMYYDDYDYDRSDALDDARYDAAMDAYDEALQPILDELVQPILDRVEETDEDQPHPWTYERALLQVWLDSPEADGAVREILEEEYREEAEDILRDSDRGPCCNDFHCPCGNSNNYRG